MRKLLMPTVLLALLALIVGPCFGTGSLPRALVRRFAAEHIVRQAENQVFRYTYYSRATQMMRWEERDASIIVTRRSVFIHRSGKAALDLTTDSTQVMEVRRRGDRVIIGAGTGQAKVSWSFRPAEDAAGWEASIRAVIDPLPEADPFLDPE
ncbi:MAG: hypothetical protein ABI587_05585 [Gemmatimonadales bacterium]